MPAIILAFLPYLFQAAQAIPEIFTFITKVREDLQQKGEWDAATEAAFNKELDDLKADPPAWWKPETPA